MMKLLRVLATGAMLAVATLSAAHALEFKAYDAATVKAAIASGRAAVVHARIITAPEDD